MFPYGGVTIRSDSSPTFAGGVFLSSTIGFRHPHPSYPTRGGHEGEGDKCQRKATGIAWGTTDPDGCPSRG